MSKQATISFYTQRPCLHDFLQAFAGDIIRSAQSKQYSPALDVQRMPVQRPDCLRVCRAKRLLAGVLKKSVAEVAGVVTLW
jgi:chorismate mutase